MENNSKPLRIPNSKRWKGLVVFCNKCKTNVFDTCKDTGKPIHQCSHGDKHRFKLYLCVPGTENERKTKILETRDINEAIKQAIEFEKEVKTNASHVEKGIEQRIEIKREVQKQNKPYLLIHALSRYIGWLHNEGVPEHLVRERSPEHIKDIERAVNNLAECLKVNGYDLDSLPVEDINDAMVGKIYSHLGEKKFANRTFNKHIGYYSSFLLWYNKEYNCNFKNCFEKARKNDTTPEPEAIIRKEYDALLKQITPENGIKEYERGVKHLRNYYRPWLADGIRLALETGLRREEVINLKWSDIQEYDGSQFIKVENYKVNRIQNRTSDNEKKFKYIPITNSFGNLLDELGYKEYANTENFILAPDIEISRKRVMSDVLSRGFSHYYDQLNTGRKLTFKCLRKTYITHLEIFMGSGNAKIITGHSNNQTIDKNYKVKKEISKVARNYEVLPAEEERNDDLKKMRTGKKDVKQQIEMGV